MFEHEQRQGFLGGEPFGIEHLHGHRGAVSLGRELGQGLGLRVGKDVELGEDLGLWYDDQPESQRHRPDEE
jgi:hypothetical protein